MESSELTASRSQVTSNNSGYTNSSDKLESVLRGETDLKAAADKLILAKTFEASRDATVVDLDGDSDSFALSLTAEEIVSKINELLGEKLPEGVESLQADQFTPEATAQRVTDQLAGLFPAFRKQNSELSDEEAIDKFLELTNQGVEQGYKEAFGTLEDLGALKFEGIQEGVEKTLSLIKEGLDSLGEELRKAFGINDSEEELEEPVQSTPLQGELEKTVESFTNNYSLDEQALLDASLPGNTEEQQTLSLLA